ncbi:MAG: O-antigen ligase family protein [Candidatus Eisenbacteria bacterium]|nr:O-antigen ligase family protein [Candidatus Eisenbacteria bacterium]
MNEHDTEDGREPVRVESGRVRGAGPRPPINPGTLFKIFAVFVIPVTAGLMLLFFDPLLVFLIAVALYASLWFLFNPFPALLLFMLLVAVRPQEGIVQLEPLHVERLCAVLAAVGWGFQVAAGRRFWPVSRGIASWLLVFVVVCFLSVFTAVWKLGAATAWIELLKLGVLAFLTSQMVNTPRRLFVFLSVFALGHVWMAAESLRLYYSVGYNYTAMGIVRATTDSLSRGDPNSLAASLVLAVCFGLYCIGANRNLFWRLCWLGVICAGSVVVVLTGSRSGMLGVLFLLFYMWITHKRRMLTGIIVMLVAVGAWVAMPMQYKERFLTIFEFQKNASAAESAMGRIEGLRVGSQMFMDRPLLGVGIGDFGIAHGMIYSPPQNRNWFEAHNLLAQVGGETGILGLIAFAGFVIVCMRGAARAGSLLSSVDTPEAKGISAVCRACLAAYWLLLLLGLFGHNMMRYNWYLNAAIVSACLVMAPSVGGSAATRATRAHRLTRHSLSDTQPPALGDI